MATTFAFTPIPAGRASAARLPHLSVAGRWHGCFIPDDAAEELDFTLIPIASPDTSVAGRFLFFTSHDVPPTGVRLLEASQASFVALIGPYYEPREDTEVVTVLEGRRIDGHLVGTYVTRFRNGDPRVKTGRFVAERPAPAKRSA